MTLIPKQSSFEFANYRLLKLSFELNSGFKQSESEDDLHYHLSIESLVKALPRGRSPKEGRSSIVRLDVSVVWSKEDGPFKLDLSCEGLFSCAPDMDLEQYQSLCELHAPALLYTQLRPLTRMIAAEAGESFVLPLINLSETLKRDRAERAASDKNPASNKRAVSDKKAARSKK